MTDDDRKPGAAADLIEDLLAEDEIERRMKMPEEQRRAELKALGLDPDRARIIANEVLAKAGFATAPAAPPGPPKVIDFAKEKEKRRRPTWVLALVAAAVLVFLVGGGGAIVALNTPTPAPTSPVPSVPTAPPGPSPQELAAQQRAKADDLRQLAKAECGQQSWDKCSKDLIDARELDPAGDTARGVQRLERAASRGTVHAEAKAVPAGPRSLLAEAKPDMVAALAKSGGQAVRLQCAGGWEPAHLCDQVQGALKAAGWNVTRVKLAAEGGAPPQGILIEVATDADEATQAAADVLAEGIEKGVLYARGPQDMAPGGDAPLRLTVGTK